MYAYGLHVAVDPDHELLGSMRQTWYPVAVVQRRGSLPTDMRLEVSADQAHFAARDVVDLTLRRSPLGLQLTAPSPVPDEVIVHPILAVVAALAARWQGRDAFHGAAVVLGGAAWVMLGAPGAGKSTLASSLSARGHAVLAEDVTVIEDGTVFCGPRLCDLREDAGLQLGRGALLDARVGRARIREQLPPAPAEVPLGGFVELAWGDELDLTPLASADRLKMMARHEALTMGPSRPTSFLDLLARPAMRLTRPQSWDALPAAAELLGAELGG